VDARPLSEDGRKSTGTYSEDSPSPPRGSCEAKGLSSWLLRWCSCQDGPFTLFGRGYEEFEYQELEQTTRRSSRSYSAPARLQTKAYLGEDAAHERPVRLIEQLFVVGSRRRSLDASPCSEGGQGEAEPSVVLRFPAAGVKSGKAAAGRAEPGDLRIASFCLPMGGGAEPSGQSPGVDWQAGGCPVPPGTPFAFTVLAAAVLPPRGPEHNYPDPTDLLYCTAVCFDEALHISCGDIDDELLDEEVAPYAYCIVSRHPFVAEFGELLLRLHSSEDLQPDLGYPCIDAVHSLKEAVASDSSWSIGKVDSAKLQSVVKKLFSDFVGSPNEDPPAVASGTPTATRRSWPQSSARLRLVAAALRAAVPGLRREAPQPVGRSYTVPPKSPGAERAGPAAVAHEISTRALDAPTAGPSAASCPPRLAGAAGAGEEAAVAAAITSTVPSLGEDAVPQQLGTFAYALPSQLSCPPWASLQARQRCDALLEWAALPLFQCLEVDVLLQVLTALLLEFRVLVVSRSVARGSAVVLGLAALLWPFAWQQLLLPICPPALEETIIDAPVPFLCAVRNITPRVGRCSALLSDGSARPRRSRSTFSTGSGMGTAAMKSGVVICQADKGTVSVPPESAHLLRRAQPRALRRRGNALARLRERLPGRSRSLGSEAALSELPPAPEVGAEEVSAVVAALCSELHAGMVELACSVRDANKDVRSELGSQGWLRQIQTRLVEASRSLADPAFQREFANTETCLLFLAEAAK